MCFIFYGSISIGRDDIILGPNQQIAKYVDSFLTIQQYRP